MQKSSADANRTTETILVVDDEDSVRKLIDKTLRRHGYQTLCAAGGPAAIDASRTFDGHIDLALIDLMMPEMSGRETYRRLLETRPDLQVIFMSGYSQLMAASERFAEPGTAFLAKPYTLAGLVSCVQQMLKTTIDI